MSSSHIDNWLSLEEANKLLEQRDRQWQALFDNALDAIAIADDEGRYVDCNPAACALFGLSKEELLRKKVADFADPNLDMTGVWQQFLQQGQQKGEFSLHRPDGRVVETEFAAVTNFIPHRHLSVLRDITNRKRAEQALRESEAKASSLTNDVIDKSPVGIFILDADFRVVWLNQTLAKFFGLRKEDVIGQDKRQLIRQRIAQIFESPELFTKRRFSISGVSARSRDRPNRTRSGARLT
jgi:PAS domain S-box-containing protein